MTTKTITITEEAYRTLAAMKQKNESFSQTILRVGKRRPLRDFLGVLNKDKGNLHETIRELRKENAIISRKKEQLILKKLKEQR